MAGAVFSEIWGCAIKCNTEKNKNTGILEICRLFFFQLQEIILIHTLDVTSNSPYIDLGKFVKWWKYVMIFYEFLVILQKLPTGRLWFILCYGSWESKVLSRLFPFKVEMEIISNYPGTIGVKWTLEPTSYL